MAKRAAQKTHKLMRSGFLNVFVPSICQFQNHNTNTDLVCGFWKGRDN
uniref:Uncharacterized protein n=1 Tax=Anguilla anguilla TaxID=7936 RepID=A0A0E9VHD9_ANGAN